MNICKSGAAKPCSWCQWKLRKLDVAKQAGYLLGMGSAWGIYEGLEQFSGIEGQVEQVVSLHWVLAFIEILVAVALRQAFDRDQLANAVPLISNDQDVTAD